MKEARMLYKVGGSEEIHGGLFTTLIIDEAEPGSLDTALKDGWSLTTAEAKSKLLEESKKQSKKQQSTEDLRSTSSSVIKE